MKRYEVFAFGFNSQRVAVIEAKNATEAKKKYVRSRGVKINDHWCGISIYKAREIK